jgi:hypothetical protein
MSKICDQNLLFNNGFTIIFQVVFIFAFLTIFFFAYVVAVEKNEFEIQINLVIDNIFNRNAIKNIIPKGIDGLSSENEDIIFSGFLDVLDDKINISSKKSVADVNKTNSSTRKKAFIILGVVFVLLIILIIILLMSGFCISIKYETKEALWIILFIGLTELAFLSFIAKSYISADPNSVKRSVATSIQEWISINKKITPSS